MWWVLVIGIAVYLISYFSPKKRFERWLAAGVDEEVDIDERLEDFANNTTSLFRYNRFNIPYGRATVFIEEFFEGESIYYGFSPIRSKDKVELKEYGILLTSAGLIIKYQTTIKETPKTGTFKKAPPKTYHSETKIIPLVGLWGIRRTDKFLTFYYPDGEEIVDLNYLPEFPFDLLYELEYLINNGVTRKLYLLTLASNNQRVGIGAIDQRIEVMQEEINELKKNLNRNYFYQGMAAGFAAGEVASGTLAQHMKDIQLNAVTKETSYRVVDQDGVTKIQGKRTGHGEAAEYGNSVIDRTFFKKVETSGNGFSNSDAPGQGANAVDRVVDGVKIQSKYLRTPEEAVRSYLSKNYPNDVALEVPPEQYERVKEILSDKNPDVKVVKGNLSYRSAQAICKAGTIPSITVDVLDGIQMSIPGATISFIFVFSQAKWNGMSTEQAAKASIKAASQTMLIGTIVYSGSQQFAKTEISKEIAKKFSKTSAQMAGYASIGITAFVVYGPTLVDALRGRISHQQLIKNSIVSTGALLGGAIGSQFAGPVGAIAGGYVGSVVSKSMADTMIEDDAEEIYELIREEFIEGVTTAFLTEEEYKEMINQTFAHKKFSKMMKDVYQHTRHFSEEEREERQRAYIRDAIIDTKIVSIYKKREKIETEEIEEALQGMNEEFFLSTTLQPVL